MYANRFEPSSRFHPGSLGAALMVNGAVVAALLFAGPAVVERLAPDDPLVIRTISLPPEPEPLPPQPRAVEDPAPATPPISAPIPQVPPLQPSVDLSTTTTIPDALPSLDATPAGTGTGTGTAPALDPPAPAPVLVDAAPDPRVDFQPDYPAAERRAERDGVVTVRIRIGTSGRVLAVESVSATSDAFWEATRRRALSAWRFRPATRDGVPVESWRRMTVRFTMED